MSKDAFNEYLNKAIKEEKSFSETISVLDTITVVVSVIIGLVGIILIFDAEIKFGIAFLISALCTYIGERFLTGAGKILINIQKANTLLLINSSKFDTSDSLKLLKDINAKSSQSYEG